MSYKGYIKFTVLGTHPLLHFTRDLLIHNGLALVTLEEADFVLVGGLAGINSTWTCDDKPVILLSDDIVYSDRDFSLKVREKKPMSEDDPILISSSLSQDAHKIIRYIDSESYYLAERTVQTMVLRTFPVYGPDVNYGLVYEYLVSTKEKKPLEQYSPGYQVRTYLHLDDYTQYVLRLVHKFREGAFGIYNVGSTESISIKRLGDTIWQLSNGITETTPFEVVEAPKDYRWWVIPDMGRTQALTKYIPKISLRTGIWSMVSK